MSVPIIPGYLQPRHRHTLAELWDRPDGCAHDLWPVRTLQQISDRPTDWVTVEEHYFTDDEHGGRGCVLIPADGASDCLAEDTWVGRDLGKVSIWSTGRFEAGLTVEDAGVVCEFFAQARDAVGGSLTVVEISQPFLWYYDAYPTQRGWSYLNGAGREQDLVRQQVAKDHWRIDVRALELRQFLSAYGRSAVLQVDHVTKTTLPEIERIDDEFRNGWAHFTFSALYHPTMPRRPTFSRLLGQYVLTGQSNARVPRFQERDRERDSPEFIYGVDPQSGAMLTHTCDPDQLGTYYDDDNSRLHYLTPVYVNREVLQPYAAEPARYRISAGRLTCLNLWGVDISFNTAGLVEVYLGDIGRDLPADEWGHWRSYNVPPRGHMEEGRFRRDFLNQIASSTDRVGDLRRARSKAARVSRRVLSAPLWKALHEDLGGEFESLVGPLADDAAALGQPLLVLTKALVDGIDPRPLKEFLGSHDKGEQSLALLTRFVETLGGTSTDVAVLASLQRSRSKGGVAHLAGSDRDRVAAELGFTGQGPWDAFQSVVVRLTAALQRTTELMQARAAAHEPESGAAAASAWDDEEDLDAP